MLEHSDIVRILVKKDLKIRYRNSVLGLIWSLLNSLSTVAIRTLVFSHLLRSGIKNFSVFLLAVNGAYIDCRKRVIDSLIGMKVKVASSEDNLPRVLKLILGDMTYVSARKVLDKDALEFSHIRWEIFLTQAKTRETVFGEARRHRFLQHTGDCVAKIL